MYRYHPALKQLIDDFEDRVYSALATSDMLGVQDVTWHYDESEDWRCVVRCKPWVNDSKQVYRLVGEILRRSNIQLTLNQISLSIIG